jgi:hypothetical protein
MDKNINIFNIMVNAILLSKNTLILVKEYIKNIVIKTNEWRQHSYNITIIFLLKNKVTGFLVKKYHLLLLYFRFICRQGGEYIEKYISLNMLALIISMICSRLHIAAYLIIVCLFLLRAEYAVVAMLRFYKKNPSIFDLNFPQTKLQTRGMWSRASKEIIEAATNPQVQTVAVAVAGALAWKALDVYDTLKEKEIADADRTAEDIRHKEALQAEDIRHKETLQAEDARHKETLQAESDQKQKDRQEENKRAAFDKMISVQYDALSEEQKDQVKHAITTGEIKLENK